MKKRKQTFIKPKIEKITSKEMEKAQARADDDGFALPKKNKEAGPK